MLAASDVIGMGVNLSIRRVVFASLQKYDGESRRPLTPAEVRQIAGRAGRYGGRYSRGEVTTLSSEDLPALRAALAAPPEVLRCAGLFPPVSAILAAAAAAPAAGLEGALRRQPDLHYTHFQPDDVIALARLLAPLSLPLPAALTLAMAPCDAREPTAAAAFVAYATAFASGRAVRVDDGATPVSLAPPRTQAELAALEAAFRVYDLYVWLALRMVRAATLYDARQRCAMRRPLRALSASRWRHHSPRSFPRLPSEKRCVTPPGRPCRRVCVCWRGRPRAWRVPRRARKRAVKRWNAQQTLSLLRPRPPRHRHAAAGPPGCTLCRPHSRAHGQTPRPLQTRPIRHRRCHASSTPNARRRGRRTAAAVQPLRRRWRSARLDAMGPERGGLTTPVNQGSPLLFRPPPASPPRTPPAHPPGAEKTDRVD